MKNAQQNVKTGVEGKLNLKLGNYYHYNKSRQDQNPEVVQSHLYTGSISAFKSSERVKRHITNEFQFGK